MALLARFKAEIKRGPVIANRAIHKTGQHHNLTRAGIPTPPAFRFVPGIKLETMTLKDYPRDHLTHCDRNGFIVQRLIDTGPLPKMHRVQTLFGVPLYCWAAQEVTPLPPIAGSDAQIEQYRIASNAGQDRVRTLVTEPDALAVSARVGQAFPDIPILALGIIRDEKTGKIYVPECNPGGNTWHFSSEAVASIRQQIGDGNEAAGRRRLIDQFGASDLAAEVLVRKVRELAA